MNEKIQSIVEQLHDKDTFIYELSKSTTRKIATIDVHWLKKDGYKVPDKFQNVAVKIALKLKEKQDRELNNINVNL